MDIWNLRDSLFYKLKATAGICKKAKPEDILALLEKGEQYSANAAMLSSFAGIDVNAVKKMQEASEKLGQFREAVAKVNSLCVDLTEIDKMSAAISVINVWAANQMDRNDPRAAKAFGELFESAGHFAGKLGPPLNQYAKLLVSCGSFFVDMQRLMNPDNRSIGGGKKLRDLRYDGTD
jgi:hypothetical protein